MMMVTSKYLFIFILIILLIINILLITTKYFRLTHIYQFTCNRITLFVIYFFSYLHIF